MGMEVKIPWTEGSIYNTMDRGVDIPWIVGQNTLSRGIDIPWVEGSKYHGMGVLYTMDKGFDIRWVEGRHYERSGQVSL